MSKPLVIGLAGGIGAGKSAAAAALADLGCLVSDSDADAKAELDVPEVRETLLSWWGARVVDPEGRVDRAAIASIIFEDADARERLEALVHPRLRAIRAGLFERAEAVGSPAMIIDAPLLFEAGLDRECDAVLFVDAPRELRLERVRQTRGWDDAELTRRERAQLPIDEKRARATAVVTNVGDVRTLRGQVAAFLRAQLESASARSGLG